MESTPLAPACYRPRRADRRPGLHALVRQVAAALAPASHGVDLLTELCTRLTHLAHARQVQVVENDRIRLGHPIVAADYAAFATPWRRGGRQPVVEASFGREARPDEWTVQLLESAASLAALVMASDRSMPLVSVARASERTDLVPLVGSSEVMQSLRDRIERVASTDFTILIEGESGVGKELVARQIHASSRRRHGPFVAINCAALVETLLEAELFGIEERTATGVRGRRGKFEHADGGTLFLDEVSELSMAAQAKLLRAIQDLTVERVGGFGSRRVDTRIVVATNRSLAGLCEKGLFRSDLYYRLSGVEVRVPALRQRKEDIMELAQYFLSRHATRRRLTISAAASDALMTYDWPGNVRELERMIEGAVATCEEQQIALDDLPIALRGAYGEVLMPSVQANDTMRAWGSRYARLVLEKCDRNKRQACEVLGISYHTLNAYLHYKSPRRKPIAVAADSSPAASPEVLAAPSELGLS